MNPTKTTDHKHKYMLVGVGTNNLFAIMRSDGQYLAARGRNHALQQPVIAMAQAIASLEAGNFTCPVFTPNLHEVRPITLTLTYDELLLIRAYTGITTGASPVLDSLRIKIAPWLVEGQKRPSFRPGDSIVVMSEYRQD
jgi:hypothetical protein